MGTRSPKPTWVGTIHGVRRWVSREGAWEAVTGGPLHTLIRRRLCDSFISNQVGFCPAVLLLKAGEIMPIFFPCLAQRSCEVRVLSLGTLVCLVQSWHGQCRRDPGLDTSQRLASAAKPHGPTLFRAGEQGRAGPSDPDFCTEAYQPHRAIVSIWPLRSSETGTGPTLRSADRAHGVLRGGSER